MKSIVTLLALLSAVNLAFSAYLWSERSTGEAIDRQVQKTLDRREAAIVAKYADAAVELVSDFGVTAERPATIEQMLDLIARVVSEEK